MEVYLDNSATTMSYPEVGELVYKIMCRDFGNPSSMHRKGVEAEHYIREAKETLAKILKVNAKEIVFTSGGTESDNLALIGCARANRRSGNHLITSSIEHPAILNTMRYLEEEEGFRVTYLPVDAQGRIKLEALREALCPETILVSVMYVNNEVGTVQPVEEAARIVKKYNPSILFHSDAVQGFGKYHIYPKRMGIDLLSASGHKIHGPKGIGFLYIADKVKIRPIVFGGEQQKNIRSRELKGYFLDGIAKIENTVVHGLTDEGSAPHIISAGIAGIRSEVLLHALEEKGIYVSSGSACSSNHPAVSGVHHPAVSGVLKGIGAAKEYLDATLRFSMSEFTTKEEIDYTLETLYNCVPMLRKYTRH